MSLFMNLFLYKFLCRGIQSFIWFMVLISIGFIGTMNPLMYMIQYMVIFYVFDYIFKDPVLTYERVSLVSAVEEEEEEEEND